MIKKKFQFSSGIAVSLYIFSSLLFVLFLSNCSIESMNAPNSNDTTNDIDVPVTNMDTDTNESTNSNDVTNDTDRDGIPDINEVPGSTFFGLSLYGYGARTNIRDIFIHINYMDNLDDKGIIPQKAALDKIVKAFSNKNINVHFDVGDLFDQSPGTDPNDYDLSDISHAVPYVSNIAFDSVKGYRNTYTSKSKQEIFYYAFFGNRQAGNYSGIAQIRGSLMLMTLGSRFTTNTSENFIVNRQAGVLMHELGHNLGLLHGGYENRNYKPNYLSIMNYMYGSRRGLPITSGQANERYSFQLRYNITNESIIANLSDGPYTTTLNIDYSDGTSLNLDENNLNEYDGVGRNLGAIDWNTNGSTNSNVSFNINPNYDINKDVFSDHDDWGNLYFTFYANANRNQLNASELSTFSLFSTEDEKTNLWHPPCD